MKCCVLVVASLSVCAAATAQVPPAASPSRPGTAMAKSATAADKAFIAEAVQGDMAEVKMGQLAQQNGSSAAVKDFGRMLETDHGQHLQKAQAMAASAGVTAPTDVNAKQQKAHDDLMKASGSSFDNAFAAAMIKDHQEDIAKYQKEAASGGAFASFAQDTLPTLQMHLKTAQTLGKTQ